MFRSIRPSSGTNVHNLKKKQAKYVKIMFKFATSRKIYNYHNIGVLQVRNNAARLQEDTQNKIPNTPML